MFASSQSVDCGFNGCFKTDKFLNLGYPSILLHSGQFRDCVAEIVSPSKSSRKCFKY